MSNGFVFTALDREPRSGDAASNPGAGLIATALATLLFAAPAGAGQLGDAGQEEYGFGRGGWAHSSSHAISGSDRRLKEKVVRTGVSPSGLPVYRFSYIGDRAVYSGVMAQDVLSHTPSAVTVDADGYMWVDYSQIDVPFVRLQ